MEAGNRSWGGRRGRDQWGGRQHSSKVVGPILHQFTLSFGLIRPCNGDRHWGQWLRRKNVGRRKSQKCREPERRYRAQYVARMQHRGKIHKSD